MPTPPAMSRRRMLKLSSGVLVGASLFGCGAGNSDALTVIAPLGDVKNSAIERLCQEYTELHPINQVEFMPVPWDQGHSKLLTMIAGGNPPDLMFLTGQWVAELRAMGALENLERWHADWEYRDMFTPIAMQRAESSAAIEGDAVYGLPFEVTVRAMFYQKQWLDELGLEPAMTRADWRTVLEKMTDTQRERYGYALRGARGGFWSWWAIAEEYSGTNEWFDMDNRCIINSPEHVAGLSYWNDLYQDGLTPRDSLNWGYTELVQGFWSGTCGCIEQDNEVVATCVEHGMDDTSLVTAIMPAGPKARVASADIWMLSMASGSGKKDAAWDLYSWLLSPGPLGVYSRDTGVIPSFKTGLADPVLEQSFYKPFVDMVSDTNNLANWYPSYLPEMGEFTEVMVTEEQQKMLLKQQSPQDTLDRLADFLNTAQRKYVDKNGPDVPRPPKQA